MRSLLRARELAVTVIFAAVFLAFAAETEKFATPDNLFTVARQYSELAVVCVGLTMVIIIGGIDISVGSMVGLSSVLVGVLAAQHGMNVWLACGCGVLAGLACGTINGLVITRAGIQPIVVTLAMMSAARGVAYVLTQGYSISGFPTAFTELGQAAIGPVPALGYVPLPVAVALAFVVAGILLLRGTAFGRGLYAVGSSEEAARLSGINVFRAKMFAYSVTGLLCGLGGVMFCARYESASPDAGVGYEFEAITAVVLGGSSLKGGEGNIAGTIIGVAVMGALRNGLDLAGVPTVWQSLLLGAALILAVLADNVRRSLRARRELRAAAS